jgi:hypothetical protein
MHAEFSSQLINYAILTLATVSFSLCKHEAAQNGKGVGRAGCQAPAETHEQLFECWIVFMLALKVGSLTPVSSSQVFFTLNTPDTGVDVVCKTHGVIQITLRKVLLLKKKKMSSGWQL